MRRNGWPRARHRSATSGARRSCANSSSPCWATTCAIRWPRSTVARSCSRKMPLDERAHSILTMMRSSVARMATLIDNVLDFARGRMGGGLALSRIATDLAAGAPPGHRRVAHRPPRPRDRHRLRARRAGRLRSARIAQLASNLIANALTHGDASKPIAVRARSDSSGFELSVVNAGLPIPAAALPRLFQPFERGAVLPGQQRAWPRPLHRLRNRPCPWRHAGGDLDARRDALHPAIAAIAASSSATSVTTASGVSAPLRGRWRR